MLLRGLSQTERRDQEGGLPPTTNRRDLVFTTLDLASGYWQVEVDIADGEKTAFTNRHGLFEFHVIPFGVCNALGTFQRLMEFVLAGLQWQTCLVYLDNVIVYGRDFDEHLRRLREVFKRLSQGRPEAEAVKVFPVTTPSTVPWSCDLCRSCQH